MRTFFAIILSGFFSCTFAQVDSLKISKYSITVGGSISPQMVFLAGLEAGAFSSIEYQPFDNPITFIGGVELRNRWFLINIGQSAGVEGLKTHYSLIGSTYAGVGITFLSKSEKDKNSFYLTANPYFFSYKESVNNEYFSNTVPRNTRGFNAGLIWSNTSISKKGREINWQFYLPLLGNHFLDDLRYMSLRCGITI